MTLEEDIKKLAAHKDPTPEERRKVMLALVAREIAIVGEWMVMEGVPTLGPGMSIKLLEIVDEMMKKVDNLPTPETKEMVVKYAGIIRMTAVLLGSASGAVIAQLADVLGKKDA